MLSYNMIPIVQENMHDIGSRINILTNVSSNAYYGYQPQVYLEEKHSSEINQNDRMDNNISNMDIQCNNNNNLCCEAMQTENIPRQVNRKRRWDHRDEFVEFKKRRQTDKCPLHCPSDQEVYSPTAQKPVHLRKPTHNIPDLPRCIMESCNLEKRKKNHSTEDENRNLLEDILRETHGVSIYHWY